MSVPGSAERPVVPRVGEAEPAKQRKCATCRWWSMHSLDLREGDCMVPGNHRYSKVNLETYDYRTGKTSRTVAYMDSFGPETTKPNFICGAWDDGEPAVAREPQANTGHTNGNSGNTPDQDQRP